MSVNDSNVLSMSHLGKMGRFGNQLFQYAFLKLCADRSDAVAECPPWIGQSLFGLDAPPVSRMLPPAIESSGTRESLFDVIPEIIPYIEHLNGQKAIRIGPDSLTGGLSHADLYGFFQFHTRHLRPHQTQFRDLFQPMADLKSALDRALAAAGFADRHIVGVHLRRGDYVTEPRVGFTVVTPAAWYAQWLERCWEQLDHPLLFVCSDDIGSMLPEFSRFDPITSHDLDLDLPTRFSEDGIRFYVDFYALSQCDTVVISNSTFSFAAAMLNRRATRFVRPVWDFGERFCDFDPWDSEPLLWHDDESRFFKGFKAVVRIAYQTQGFFAAARCLMLYFPGSCLRQISARIFLGYHASGVAGVVKVFLRRSGR